MHIFGRTRLNWAHERNCQKGRIILFSKCQLGNEDGGTCGRPNSGFPPKADFVWWMTRSNGQDGQVWGMWGMATPTPPAHIHLGPGGEDKVQGRARTLKTRWYNTCWMCWRWHANLLLNILSISYQQFCTYDEYLKVLITFNRLDQVNCWILGLSTQGHKL